MSQSEGTNPGTPKPATADATQFQPNPAPADVAPEDIEERTRFIAPDDMAQAAPAPPPPSAPPPSAPPPSAPPSDPAPTSSSPRVTQNPFAVPAPSTARKIEIGDVLNHTYEVRRFIARGGMGEVYEGVNINAEDDRVAIKVMLPHLAADPLVQAMFSKEAKTLTRLRHPGLVQYRLLGREPVLGVTYIVTEFVDGVNLSDVLKTLEATPEDLITLLRRLAAALGAAHELDAVHRDISPDNVLLEGGQLKNAKIIDFGIAKDLDAGAKTIVGEGFAGKLGYVAPEQLGSYGRSVGGWSDVYSLALVMLAVAQKKDVDMGGSLADAFDKRKEVPDLSAAPDELRPILAKMLEPDPANRLRSMDAVLAELNAIGGGGLEQATRLQFDPNAPGAAPLPAGPNKTMLIGGGAAALLLAVGGWFVFGRGVSDPQGAAELALATGLREVSCSWLDVGSVQARDQTIDVTLRGVSGKVERAKTSVAELLDKAGLEVGEIDFTDVKQIEATDCSPIDAFRQIRDYGPARLNVSQRQFEMSNGRGAKAGVAGLAAAPMVEIDRNKLDTELAVFGLEESGAITPLIMSEGDFSSFDTKEVRAGVVGFELFTTHKGWSGILLLKGKGPFDPTLLEKGPGEVSPSWVNRFLQAAKAQGWKSEMIWYRTADETPG